MERILQKIANTIIANLGNTDQIGLFNGKMGLSLFLYKYARYSGCEIYEETASSLLDDIFKQLNNGMSPSAIDGLAGIGYGIISLLKDNYLDNDPEDDILHDIDHALFANARSVFTKEAGFPIPLLSSGLYLSTRIEYQKETVENTWIAGVIDNVRLVIDQSQKKYRPKLSLLNSILYVLTRLYHIVYCGKSGILNLQKERLPVSIQAINAHAYQDIDTLLFKKLLLQLPPEMQTQGQGALNAVKTVIPLSNVPTQQLWYDNLWWSILYETAIVPALSWNENTLPFIEQKIQDAFYDESTVNNKLAAVGLWILQNEIKL